MQKFESEIKQLSAPQVRVYEKFSDLRNLQALRERLNDPLVQEKMQAALSDEQVAEAKKQLETLTFDADNVTIQSPVGQVTLTVVEREEPKLIKFESAGSPVPLNLWIQIMPLGEGSKLKVTIGAEVNMFMRAMVAKPLKKAADGLANMLSAVAID
ncbi:hypothetical protein JJE62_07835 [Alloprevotella tannerae]|uniref:hypothetical protein n=1 Tax=Alloprevotella tannerae TaxID=76122 RepID=UPI001EDA1016|nr:hypothetical protein [Alloprevotella tannerae]MCG2647361.1 hypothetical protein [Alloprevotella tannerae]